MSIVDLGKPFLWMKLVQFVLGLVCYSLYFAYYWSNGVYTVRENLTQVAAVAFPFVILPCIVLVSFLEGEGMADHMIFALFSFCGLLVTIIAGSVTISFSSNPGVTAAGAICIIYSFSFLADVLWYGYMRIKGK